MLKKSVYSNQKGFSLLELLLASSVSILLAGFAIPGFKHLTDKNKIDAEAQRLHSIMLSARSDAISHGANYVLCGASKASTCDQNWEKGYLLFVDTNNDNQFNENEDRLVSYYPQQEQQISIQWSSFRKSSPIRFLPQGITWHNNGTFILCLNKDEQYARALFVAKSGRIELSKDENNDGIDELRSGKSLSCA